MSTNRTGTGESPETTVAEREVADVIEIYRQGFLQLKPELLWSIWDQGQDPLIYVAMEKVDPIYGWAAIKQYYAALPEHLEKMESKELDDVRIDLLGDTALVFFNFHSVVKLKGHEGLYRPAGRATMLLRHTQAGWRVIHFHESALAAQAVHAK
jgi:ketosteroid isomerase-like protein